MILGAVRFLKVTTGKGMKGKLRQLLFENKVTKSSNILSTIRFFYAMDTNSKPKTYKKHCLSENQGNKTVVFVICHSLFLFLFEGNF